MKKILVINGSGRKNGNAAGLASHTISVMKTAGAQIDLFNLCNLYVHPCMGCHVCAEGNILCTQNDGITDVIEKMFDADALLVSTPIYFGRINATTQIWCNRLMCLFQPSNQERFVKKENRKFGLIITFHSDKTEEYAKEADYVGGWLKRLPGVIGDQRTLMAGKLLEKGDYRKHPEHIESAAALGEWLIQ
jgi:multimeric flavodoxin WrbA